MEDSVTQTRTALKRPSMWTCVFVNDDYTPMGFVIETLMEFFHLARAEAETITLEVHSRGKSAVGSFPKEIAQHKADQVMAAAAWRQFPLQVIPTKV